MSQSPFFAAVLAAAALAACSKSPPERVSAAPAPPPSITQAIAPSARADIPPSPAQPAAEKQDEPTAAEKAEFERPVRK